MTHTTRIYACRGGACMWQGSIDDMPVVKCPMCGGGYLEHVGDVPTEIEVDPRTIFSSRRTRNREAEVDEKSEKKRRHECRPGIFERVANKIYFRRS